MSRRSIPFSLIGLTLGVLLGIGIVYLKSLILDELIGVLYHEVKGSCNCTLEYDSRSLSFLRLRAEIKNIRVVENGVPKLQFKELTSTFGFSALKQKKLYLDLILDSGFSDGVGPSSATYRFLDFLTKPSALSKDPNRWKIKVRTLQLKDASLYEKVSSGYTLEAHGTSLMMVRDDNNEFDIAPVVKELRFIPSPDKSGETPVPISIGGLSASFHLGDDVITILSAELAKLKSKVLLQGTITQSIPGIPLQLQTLLSLDLPSFLPSVSKGSINSTGTITGEAHHAQAQGSLALQSPIEHSASHTEIVSQLSGKYEFNDSTFTIPELNARGGNSTFTLSKPISLSSKALSGTANLLMERISIGDSFFNNVEAVARLSGDLDAPKLLYQVTTSEVLFNSAALSLPATTVRGDVTPSTVTAVVTTGEEKILDITYGIGAKTATKVIFNAQKIPLSKKYFISGNASGEGLIANNSFVLQGKLSLLTSTLTRIAAADVKLTPQELNLTGGTIDRSLKGSLRTNFETGNPVTNLTAQLINFSGLHDPNVETCVAIDGDLKISQTDKTLGTLNVTGARLGCGESQLALSKPAVVKLEKGIVTIPSTTLSGTAGKITLGGTLVDTGASQISIEGSSELSPFSSLIPSVDGISGSINVNVHGTGPSAHLTFTGGAQIKEGGLSSESLGLTAENLNGSLSLEGGGTVAITGRLNGGHLAIEGCLSDPKVPLRATLKSVMLSPTPESSLETSAVLTMSALNSEGPPLISGTLTVDNGMYSKNIDIAQIIQDLIVAIAQSKNSQVVKAEEAPNAPNLDIQISVPGNLFISTNIGDAELIGNLHISGSSAAPDLEGALETLSGSFLIKENRFEIISAKLAFTPLNTQPSISLLASTSARSPNGELVQVMIDAQGPLNNPKISFSSDRPMTEQELLTLVAFGGRTVDRTGSMPLNQSKIEFVKIDRDDESLWSLLFSKLTRIDALNFEPQYNARSGLIEPRVLMRKDITSHLALIGESNLGGSETYRRLKLLYGMTPNVNVTTYIEETGGRNNSALGADIIWSVLKDDFTNTKVSIKGLPTSIRRQELIQAMKLYENYTVLASSVTRLESLGLAFLRQHGYLGAHLKISCTKDDKDACSHLSVTLNAGDRATIKEIRLIGDPIPGEIVADDSALIDKEASIDTAQDYAHYLVRQLREHGYYSARVSTEILLGEKGSLQDALVQFDITRGRKIIFTFTGNKEFNQEELLAPLELIKRKFPFGPNSVATLIESIRQAYIDKNYFGTEVTFTRSISGDDAIDVQVVITEGIPVTVKRSRVVGLLAVKKKDFITTYEAANSLPSPFDLRTIDSKLLNQVAARTKNALTELGYPEAKVSWNIEIPALGKARPIFAIQEGAQELVRTLTVTGHSLQHPPLIPNNLTAITAILDKEILSLHEQGYANATYVLQHESSGQYEALYTLGTQVQIGGIRVVGATPSHESLVRSKLSLAIGSFWNTTTLSAEQRKLLSLGLFSRVTFAPEDGNLNDEREVLVITVKERSGDTLEIGAGANSEFGAHLFAEAVDRAYFDDGRTISLRLDAYYDPSKSDISQGISELRYLVPNLRDSTWSLAEAIRYQRLDLTTYEFNLDRLALSSTLLSSKNNGMVTSVSHTLSDETLDSVSPDAIVGKYDSGSVRLGYLSALLRYQSLDEPVNPTRGYSLTLDSKLATPLFGSEASFASVGSRLVALTPIGRSKFGFALTVGAQFADAFGSTDEVPISQRYYLGGRTSIRGFRENSLGPRGSNGAVIGGDSQAYSSLELRYRILEKISLHSFVDAGNVFLQSDSSSLSLEKSVGMGVSYLSPIGPIGFDVGHPLGSPEGQSSVRFHFTIGSGF